MIYRVACLLARIRFTVGYVAALASVSTTILMHGPQVHAQVIRHASTNLHNLAHGHLGTLWNSAFVIDEGPLYFWLPCLACLLAVAELQLQLLAADRGVRRRSYWGDTVGGGRACRGDRDRLVAMVH